jgi:hypothetical protein
LSVPGAVGPVSVNAAGEPANVDTLESSVSADDRFVAFVSQATNLVPGDTNFGTDIFVRVSWMTSLLASV